MDWASWSFRESSLERRGALRPITRGNIQFHEQRDPALTADVNDVEFSSGDVMDRVGVAESQRGVYWISPTWCWSFPMGGCCRGRAAVWCRGWSPSPPPLSTIFFPGRGTELVIPRGAPAGPTLAFGAPRRRNAQPDDANLGVGVHHQVDVRGARLAMGRRDHRQPSTARSVRYRALCAAPI